MPHGFQRPISRGERMVFMAIGKIPPLNSSDEEDENSEDEGKENQQCEAGEPYPPNAEEDNMIVSQNEWNQIIEEWDLQEYMDEVGEGPGYVALPKNVLASLDCSPEVQHPAPFSSAGPVCPGESPVNPTEPIQPRPSRRRANLFSPGSSSSGAALTPPVLTTPPVGPQPRVSRRRKSLFPSADTPSTSGTTPSHVVPLVVKQKKAIKTQKMNLKFSKTPFSGEVTIPTDSFRPPPQDLAPVDYFDMFMKRDCLEIIAYQTTLYSAQKNGDQIRTDVLEITKFVGMMMIMGVVKMNALQDYWDLRIRFSPVADAMTYKRFKVIRQYLHFADNDDLNPDDRFSKVRPILDHVRQNCLQIEQEKRSSIDEMIIPYKGKKSGGLRQYNPKKPRKWGYKLFVRAGVSGIIYDFLPYAGEKTFFQHDFSPLQSKYFGIGQKVVLVLCKSIPDPPCSVVYMDNWFTNLELQWYMRKELGILSLGTIRPDRIRGAALMDTKVMEKKGRGTVDFVTDNGKQLMLAKWMDNKAVHISSTYVGAAPAYSVVRYSKEHKAKIPISCPQIIHDYNLHMGGVDKAGMLISLYRTPYRTRRYYKVVFFQLLDACICNAWLLYCGNMDLLNLKEVYLKDFRIELSLNFLAAGSKPKVGRPLANNVCTRKIVKRPLAPRPPDDVRKDKIDHTPQNLDKRGRCKLCQKKTSFACTKCNGTQLCILSTRNCFVEFHAMKSLPKLKKEESNKENLRA